MGDNLIDRLGLSGVCGGIGKVSEVGVSEEGITVFGVHLFSFGCGFVKNTQLDCLFDGQACVEERFEVGSCLSHYHVPCEITLKVLNDHSDLVPVSWPVFHLSCL